MFNEMKSVLSSLFIRFYSGFLYLSILRLKISSAKMHFSVVLFLNDIMMKCLSGLPSMLFNHECPVSCTGWTSSGRGCIMCFDPWVFL